MQDVRSRAVIILLNYAHIAVDQLTALHENII